MSGVLENGETSGPRRQRFGKHLVAQWIEKLTENQEVMGSDMNFFSSSRCRNLEGG